MKVRLPQLAFVALILLIWHLLSTYQVVQPINLPRLSSMAEAFPQVVISPDTRLHFRVTMYEFLAAFSAALVAGLSLGFTLGAIRYLGGVFEPIILGIYAIPIILFYPLCILVFGIGSASKIAFAGVYGFLPIAINTITGVRTADPAFLQLSRSLGANWWQMNLKIIFPSSLPAIMTGIRMGMIFSLIGVIAGEMLAATRGIGYRISWAAETFNTPFLFSYIILVVLIVFFVNIVMAFLENRVAYS